ncbi:MAG TPA: MBL fold metallo-hydrolase [Anaerolineaceae bacterium]|nr:MBL fold metallo-hydrolase [Anaerolineaceae bacterium]
MKIRYLGHSCVEIVGRHHILIDPDFTREPLPDVEYICVSHAHKDHLGKVAQIPTGIVLASQDVCEIALKMGVPSSRLQPVSVGEHIDNIEILPGFSVVKDPVYFIFRLLFRFSIPDPGGTPLSFFLFRMMQTYSMLVMLINFRWRFIRIFYVFHGALRS